MASPIAASAAATVRMNRAKIWPTRSPRNAENATKFRLTASKISSIDIRMMITFLRFRNIPKKLKRASFQLGKVEVEHHHDEEKKNRDGTYVDDHENHREEFGPEQHEQGRSVKESKDEKQDGMDGITRRDDRKRGQDHDRREH